MLNGLSEDKYMWYIMTLPTRDATVKHLPGIVAETPCKGKENYKVMFSLSTSANSSDRLVSE